MTTDRLKRKIDSVLFFLNINKHRVYGEGIIDHPTLELLVVDLDLTLFFDKVKPVFGSLGCGIDVLSPKGRFRTLLINVPKDILATMVSRVAQRIDDYGVYQANPLNLVNVKAKNFHKLLSECDGIRFKVNPRIMVLTLTTFQTDQIDTPYKDIDVTSAVKAYLDSAIGLSEVYAVTDVKVVKEKYKVTTLIHNHELATMLKAYVKYTRSRG